MIIHGLAVGIVADFALADVKLRYGSFELLRSSSPHGPDLAEKIFPWVRSWRSQKHEDVVVRDANYCHIGALGEADTTHTRSLRYALSYDP
jgi:hypothetical protein